MVQWKLLTNRKGALSVDTAHALGKITKVEIVWAADTVSQSQRDSLTTTMASSSQLAGPALSPEPHNERSHSHVGLEHFFW